MRSGTRLPARATRALIAVLPVLALLATGCAEKVTSVDAAHTAPEGTPNPDARLIVFEDRAVPREYWADFSPPGPSPEDVLDSVVYLRKATPATQHGMILDGTAAQGYEVYRREEGGGVRRLLDFITQPSARWVDSHWELYSFQDDDPTRAEPPTYQGRGLLGGAVTVHSPVTNTASNAETTLVDPGLRIVHGQPPNEFHTDSLFTLAWNAVPGAVAYYLHVFQFRGDLRDELERTLAGVPAPFFEGKSRDVYAVYLPAGVTRYRIGDAPAGGAILTRRQTFFGQVYYARLSAVNAAGRMIAFTPGDLRIGPYDTGYTLQPLGAIVVATTKLPPGVAGRPRIEAPAARAAWIVEAGGSSILHLER